jgi:hypothetical protein
MSMIMRARITHVIALLFVLGLLVELLPARVVSAFMQSAIGPTNVQPAPAGTVGPLQRILNALS